MNAAWFSVHIFDAGDRNALLNKVVAPLLRRFRQDGRIHRGFFIRYGEGGPHIRLRLLAEPSVHEAQLWPTIVDAVEVYFGHANHLVVQPDKEGLYPDASVQVIPYEPETVRYGGIQGVAIAEQLFEASSNAVLALLAEGELTYERALGAAIQMHIAMLHRFSFSQQDMAGFAELMYQAWLPHVLMTAEHVEQSPDQLAQRLEALADQQAGAVAAFIDPLLEGLSAGEEFDAAWFSKWLDDLTQIANTLAQTEIDGQLEYRNSLASSMNMDLDGARLGQWLLYESYAHMTNNRLGIFNQDEAYLGCLMAKALQR